MQPNPLGVVFYIRYGTEERATFWHAHANTGNPYRLPLDHKAAMRTIRRLFYKNAVALRHWIPSRLYECPIGGKWRSTLYEWKPVWRDSERLKEVAYIVRVIV